MEVSHLLLSSYSVIEMQCFKQWQRNNNMIGGGWREKLQSSQLSSPVPRPPLFFVLWFAFSIIHGSARARKRGRPVNTYHVNDVRWTQGGRRGGGVRIRNNVLDFIIERFTARQDPRRSQDHEYSA